jgi:hypothetical protein
MANHPILTKLLCVALVASIMLPVGRMIFPFVDAQHRLDGVELEPAHATIGFGLHAAIFS